MDGEEYLMNLASVEIDALDDRGINKKQQFNFSEGGVSKERLMVLEMMEDQFFIIIIFITCILLCHHHFLSPVFDESPAFETKSAAISAFSLELEKADMSRGNITVLMMMMMMI